MHICSVSGNVLVELYVHVLFCLVECACLLFEFCDSQTQGRVCTRGGGIVTPHSDWFLFNYVYGLLCVYNVRALMYEDSSSRIRNC